MNGRAVTSTKIEFRDDGLIGKSPRNFARAGQKFPATSRPDARPKPCQILLFIDFLFQRQFDTKTNSLNRFRLFIVNSNCQQISSSSLDVRRSFFVSGKSLLSFTPFFICRFPEPESRIQRDAKLTHHRNQNCSRFSGKQCFPILRRKRRLRRRISRFRPVAAPARFGADSASADGFGIMCE